MNFLNLSEAEPINVCRSQLQHFMAKPFVVPTLIEVEFSPDELIVSKSDLRGTITYANDVFRRVSGYSESELLGQPHNVIRHPDMPACIFQTIWAALAARREVFAYIVNLARDGRHYWVFAHVTPSFDRSGAVVGYHSNRRAPHADALPQVKEIYSELRSEELRHADRTDGLKSSAAMLAARLQKSGVSYDQFVFGLSNHTRLGATD